VIVKRRFRRTSPASPGSKVKPSKKEKAADGSFFLIHSVPWQFAGRSFRLKTKEYEYFIGASFFLRTMFIARKQLRECKTTCATHRGV
jgi:hypothetical protein